MTEIINQKKQKITNVGGNILAIDVSTRDYHVAVCPNNSSIIYEISDRECELEDFFTLTEKILNKTGIKLENIKNIICSRGPSSFTGVRKNLTVLNALNFDGSFNLFTISHLAAQSYEVSVKSRAEIVLLANDAKREQIFFAIYQFKKNNDVCCLVKDSIMSPEDVIKPTVPNDQSLCFAGDAWNKYQQRFPESLRNISSVAVEPVLASTLISLSQSYSSLMEPATKNTQPNYLRHPVN